MDTAGEPPAKRVKRTHRGRRSSVAQENQRDQRKRVVFSWFVCVLRGQLRIMERQRQNEESAEQARHHRTAGQMLEERMSRDGSGCERYVSSWWYQCGQGARAILS